MKKMKTLCQPQYSLRSFKISNFLFPFFQKENVVYDRPKPNIFFAQKLNELLSGLVSSNAFVSVVFDEFICFLSEGKS